VKKKFGFPRKAGKWERIVFSEFASKEAVDRMKANPNDEKEKVGS